MFGDKLKTLREERGLSQSQLAGKLYVTRQAVSKWERGAGMPDIPSLQKIADFFCVTIDDLTNEKPLPNRPIVYEPLSNRTESGIHYLWDIFLSLGLAISLAGATYTSVLAMFDSSYKVFLVVVTFLASLLSIGIPVGFFFWLNKRGSKGYWILTREIELFALAFAFIGLVVSMLSLGETKYLLALIGFVFLTIYGVALSFDIRLFTQSPKEAKK
ncbi:MAG: helix-turn-helix transcriptional regulator [Bacilli bacterium]